MCQSQHTYVECLETHTTVLGLEMWMFSTVGWTPQAELDTLSKKADSLSPAEVKAELLRLAEGGKVCACGSGKYCFQLVKKLPEVKLTKSGFGDIQ